MPGKQHVVRKENTMIQNTGSRRRMVEGDRQANRVVHPGIEGPGWLRSRTPLSALLLGMALIGFSARPARAVPSLTLDESALHFGNQKVGTTSSARTVVVTNFGPGALEISGINLTGADASDFDLRGLRSQGRGRPGGRASDHG
jgi:hypothetical protein